MLFKAERKDSKENNNHYPMEPFPTHVGRSL